jgi:hypothetical protein
MALEISIKTPFGITATNAYVKITNFFGTKDQIQVTVAIYFSKETRESGHAPIQEVNYWLPIDVVSGNLLPAIYLALKSLPEYSLAIDV